MMDSEDLGTKIHVAVESNGLPISIRTSPANQHDSTKFIDVLENISDFLNDDLIHAIVSGISKGYDAAYIRNYLSNVMDINFCIPYKKNSKTVSVLSSNVYKMIGFRMSSKQIYFCKVIFACAQLLIF